MKVVVNNLDKNKCKLVMGYLMELIQNKNTSASDKKKYYKEYLELSANYLILSR